MTERRVLITGTSGFIGSHLAEYLVANGCVVRGFDASPYPYSSPHGEFEAFTGDITAISEVEEAAKDCNGIIHLAGVSRRRDVREEPLRCIEVNVIGATNVLEVARLSPTTPWIVMGSTREVPDSPESLLELRGLNGLTKYCAELFARQYSEHYKMRVLAMRFSDVYGSTRDHSNKALPIFVRAALRNDVIKVRDPLAPFDFTYYEDVLSGVLQGCKFLEGCPLGYFGSLYLCTGRTITVQELAETVVAELGSSSPIQVDLEDFNVEHEPLRNDSWPARELIGFQAETSLENGLRRMGDQNKGNND
jgi:nucleoside-diphosphate-sugar epimerase